MGNDNLNLNRPIVYIAGPFRAKDPKDHWEQEQNIRRAENLALKVWKLGYPCLCPHLNTRFFQGAHGIEDEVWLSGDLEMMLRCDIILALPNYYKSRGAVAEVLIAVKNGIRIFYSLEELKEFKDLQDKEERRSLVSISSKDNSKVPCSPQTPCGRFHCEHC